ncbi:MAG: acetyl-CoA carboxylase biotin carboxyl carrier protein subunit [Deltaproteobacteria bacterium]|nr:acetyl-CoA carboxylase biotin carboxyl carrier protein subunit [Deltaproteobacteria bacterium]
MLIEVRSPMAGKIISVKVNAGDMVAEEDELVIMEAMKMEIPIVAPSSGRIRDIKIEPGQEVEAESVIAVIEN